MKKYSFHRFYKTVALTLAATLTMALAAGCGAAPASSPSPAAPTSGTDAPAAAPHEKVSVTIGTGGTAGTYYVVAAAMAQAINESSEWLTVDVQSTKGSVENLNLCNSGDIEFGMSNADGVYWATTGTGTYDGKPQKIKNAMTLYSSAGQCATLTTSGIANYGDLKGKKVCLGPPSTTIVEMSKAILRKYGIDPDKDITPYFLSFDEGLSALKDGDIDASFFVGGVPTSAMIDACSGGNIRFVDVSTEVLDGIVAESPFYSQWAMPANTYNGQTTDYMTLQLMTEIFVGSHVPDDVVYEFVSQALKNVDKYMGAHTVCKEITPETCASSSSEYAQGAVNYYKEVGAMK